MTGGTAVDRVDLRSWSLVGEGVTRTEDHRYGLAGSAVLYPGVTGLLKTVGLVDYDAPWFTPTSRELGTALHRAAVLYLEGSLDWTTLDDRIRDDVAAFATFVRETGFTALLWERPLASAICGFGGTFDLFGTFANAPTRYGVVDLKRRTVGKVTRLQLAGYQVLLSTVTGISDLVIGRWGWTVRNGKPSLVPYDHRDRRDLHTMVGIASVVNWARAEGVTFNRKEVEA